MKTLRISRIGGRALPTALELPSDVSVVGVQYSACRDGDGAKSRDITYILMTAVPLAELRRLYKRKWSGVDIRWAADDPSMFSFTAFRQGGQYRSDAVIYLLLPEPPDDGGIITVPLLLKP